MMLEDGEYIESEEDFHQRVMTHYELVRQHCIKVFSLSPLHQARAAKDPEYWTKLGTMGRWDIPGVESPVRRKKL